MAWRLGIDLGTNSLGWAALTLPSAGGAWEDGALMDAGVRIFSDGRNPKDRQSNAAKRREPRGSRKNRDRYLRRRNRLMRQLIQFGLMPNDEADRKALEGEKGKPLEDTDPWILRTRGLDEKLSLYQLGRAIFHLHQRRGFKSNRKTDRGDTESGKVNDATKRTLGQLAEQNARTLGELFGRRRLDTHLANQDLPKGKRAPQPLARVRKSGDGANWQYDYYPTRDLILKEFDRLWEAQLKFHGDSLSNEARTVLRDTIEWQHKLKSPPVGKCTLIPTEERASKALPSSQQARIYQEINNLRITPAGEASRELRLEERDALARKLLHPTNKTAKLTFKTIRSKILDLSERDAISLETEKRKDITGDETAARLMQEERWGPDWLEIDLAVRDEIVDRLINEEKETVLIDWLMKKFNLDKEKATRIADCPLPDGYGRLSKVAIDQILPALKKDVTTYDKAVGTVFPSHSEFSTGEVLIKLPYYGYILDRHVAFGTGVQTEPDEKRYGKIANPTVHVALNQVRAVVNDLIERFGQPAEIVLELARDLPLSAKGKGELDKRQKDNQDANDKRRVVLAQHGIPDSYQNRMRLRLFEDLDVLGKRCVFTGEHISMEILFTDKVEIEHILPFSQTFDDSYNNKTLAMRQANRDKKNQTPFAAFGDSRNGYDWEEISKRAAELPPGKRWRFSPDAMDRFQKDGGFIARQLTDTQYTSRLAKAYLEALYPEKSKSCVWVTPGRLTADLRWQWGLDSVLRGHNEDANDADKKNRHDHRHHAIDAIVVALTDRALLQRAAKEAKQNEEIFDRRLMAGIENPWASFRDDVVKTIEGITISHKPDHGIQDAMHNETAYGFLKGKDGQPDKRGVQTIVTRKPLDSDAFKSAKDLEKIRDDVLRHDFRQETEGLTGKDFKAALISAGANMKPPVYKVRITENLKVIPIKNKFGKSYKAYKGDGNYCYDIWVDEKGKWTGEVITTFQAYQLSRENENWWRKLIGREGQKLIMRLRKNDLLEIDHDGARSIVQVYKFSAGTINLAENREANASARVRSGDLQAIAKAPSSLQKANAKRVTVSPSGLVKRY